jgi:hypothetical protein
MWMLLESIEWRWPPDVLARQEESLMLDLATISWLNRRIKAEIDQEQEGIETWPDGQ